MPDLLAALQDSVDRARGDVPADGQRDDARTDDDERRYSERDIQDHRDEIRWRQAEIDRLRTAGDKLAAFVFDLDTMTVWTYDGWAELCRLAGAWQAVR